MKCFSICVEKAFSCHWFLMSMFLMCMENIVCHLKLSIFCIMPLPTHSVQNFLELYTIINALCFDRYVDLLLDLHWKPSPHGASFVVTGGHYNDVIMSVIVSQITSLTIVYTTVNSGADQRKHESSASLAFVRGIHGVLVNSPHKWPVTRKKLPFDDVIMAPGIFLTKKPGQLVPTVTQPRTMKTPAFQW